MYRIPFVRSLDAPLDRPASSLHRIVTLAVLTLAALTGCAPDTESDEELPEPGVEQWVSDLPAPVERDFDQIVADDTLTALLVYNSTSYFLYRGEAMGFEFRALREFADAHGLVLEPRVVRDRTELLRLLNEGEGDVVAARLVPLPELEREAAFTRPLYETRPAVVQRTEPLDSTDIPADLAELVDSATGSESGDAELLELQARLIERPRELAGDTVTLPKGSEYFERVVELADTIDETIELVELQGVISDEGLLRRVAAGAVRLTVSPENVAELNDDAYSNIAVRPVIGPKHAVSWAVRSNAPALRDSLDAWIGREKEGEIANLYQTYFVDRQGYRERVESDYLTSETGRLSEYDSLIAVHAETIGWDWRLLASQTFQESRFDARARSWAGARGLLQLMPATAREMGVRDPYDPVENVEGAVRYLEWLTGAWEDDVPDPEARLPFILASYNAGRGHVLDARRLAEKNGDDPNDWEEVSFWMLQLSKRQYYRDPVVRFGYARGLEPVTYVSLIRERYRHYREFVTGDPLGGVVTEEEAVTGDRTGRPAPTPAGS